MQNLKFLNKKEIKNILDLIRKQWDCDAKLDYVFSMNEKGKIYIVNREISEIDLSKLRISSIGLYFGTLVEGSSLRLSIEGSQLVGPKAKKNVFLSRLNNTAKKANIIGIIPIYPTISP